MFSSHIEESYAQEPRKANAEWRFYNFICWCRVPADAPPVDRPAAARARLGTRRTVARSTWGEISELGLHQAPCLAPASAPTHNQSTRAQGDKEQRQQPPPHVRYPAPPQDGFARVARVDGADGGRPGPVLADHARFALVAARRAAGTAEEGGRGDVGIVSERLGGLTGRLRTEKCTHRPPIFLSSIFLSCPREPLLPPRTFLPPGVERSPTHP